jgi:hypothetical protein
VLVLTVAVGVTVVVRVDVRAGHDTTFPVEPESVEGPRGRLTPEHDSVGLRRVTPVFYADLVLIGEDVGYAVVRHPSPEHVERRRGPLASRVVPVLDAQASAVEGMVSVGHVPDGEHVGLARPEVFVRADRAVYGDSGPPDKTGSWFGADGGNDEVGLDGATVAGPHSPDRFWPSKAATEAVTNSTPRSRCRSR